MKKCTKCGVFKSLDDFPVRSNSKDGRRNECKSCKRLRDAEAWQKRVSDPLSRKKEIERVKRLYESKTPQEKELMRKRANENNSKRVEEANRKFLEEHGCTKKEFKRRQDEQEFIALGKILNGDKYDYSKVNYQGVYPEVIIFCNKHQQNFQQSPKSHKKGSGCPLCAKEQCGLYHKKSQDQFIKEAQNFCGDKYTFECVNYVNYSTHVDINCVKHGLFPIKPANLFNGRGCPSCAEYGYNKSKPGVIYVLASDDIVKIGITNRSSEIRAKDISKSSGKKFKVVWDFWFADGNIPADIEASLLEKLREQYEQPSELFDGSTECFYNVDHEWLLSKIDELIMECVYANS